jgi:hypothetical protein
MIGKIEIDIEVDPLPLRRNLKFLVSPDVVKVRADEQLGDIPIPKAVGFLYHNRRRLQIEFLVGAFEKEIQIFLRPSRAYSRAIPGNCVSIIVGFGIDIRGPKPEWRLRICVDRYVMGCVSAHESAVAVSPGVHCTAKKKQANRQDCLHA